MAPTKPKSKWKRRRLLDPSKTTDEAKKIIESNAANSPLFRLDSAIRNIIYDFVFGGHRIHVIIPNSKTHRLVPCRLPQPIDDPSIAHEASSVETYVQHKASWCDRHSNCNWDPAHGPQPATDLHTSFLLVSKQAHQETALLPFTLNEFLFRSPQELSYFANKLLMVQKLAVTAIEVQDDADRLILKAVANRIVKLRGLRRLTLNVHHRYELPHANKLSPRLEEYTRIFAPHSLNKLDVQLSAGHLTRQHHTALQDFRTGLLRLQGA